MKERIKAAMGTIGILAGNVAGMFGLTVADNVLVQLLVGLAMLAMICAGMWFNFNFTEAASVCQRILDAMKRFDAEVIEQAKELAAKASADEAQEAQARR